MLQISSPWLISFVLVACVQTPVASPPTATRARTTEMRIEVEQFEADRNALRRL